MLLARKESHFLAETASTEGPLDEEIHRFGQDTTEIMLRPSVDDAAEEAKDRQSTQETEMMPLPVEVGEIHQSSEETEQVVLVEEADKIHRSSEETEMVPVEEAGKIHQSSEETEMKWRSSLRPVRPVRRKLRRFIITVKRLKWSPSTRRCCRPHRNPIPVCGYMGAAKTQ